MSKSSPCYVSVLTPPGRSAVATIGVCGPDAARCIQAFFSPATQQNLADAPLQRTLFGRWRESDDDSGEELVICRVGTDRWEIHSHGGSAAVGLIKSSLQSLACYEVNARSWLEQTGHDFWQTEALLKLSACRTERAAAMMLDQYRGATRQAFAEICGLAAAERWEELQQRLARLREVYPYVANIDRPWRVLIVGAPNVGKSSLINALLGYERAIVFDQPGTTRDVVSSVTALAGWLFEFSDTAGIRSTSDEIEAAGIERIERELPHVDLVMLVRDATRPNDPLPVLPSEMRSDLTLHLWNKCDVATPPHDSSALRISAATGRGIEELKAGILTRLCRNPPLPGEAVPLGNFTMSWVEALHDDVCRGDHTAVQKLTADIRSGWL